MRTLLLATLVVVGLCVSGDAQTAQKSPGPILTFSATSAQSADPNVTRLSGNVVITFTGGTALADSATIHRSTNEIELSGNVRLRLDAPPQGK